MDDLLSRHFISLALVFLFAVWLISQRVTRDKELRYFWLTVVCCFLLVVEDQLETAASEDPSLITWRILFSVAGYTLRSLAAAGLTMVVCPPELRRRWIWIPCIINFLVCCTAFFTDIAFGYDENYKFYRGPLGYVSFIVPVLYLAAILWLTIRRYGDSGRKRDQLILLPCAALCLLSALLDATRGGVRLHEAMMISSIFFYVFLRSYNVRRDPLTLLLNRSSLYDDCRSLGKDVCAAASLDMNGLKELNDREGQAAGDAALKKIGGCILEIPDPQIRAYRIGGDEFVILFFGKDEIMIRQTMDRIRRELQEAGVSVSTGYSMREGNEDPQALIRKSDMKMFEYKARYYRDRQHDRRRTPRVREGAAADMDFSALLESPQPVAVYRFSNHRVEPLAVSDGFCRLFGYPDRNQALNVLDRERYKDVHTDDLERFSGAVLRFSEGSALDVIYRSGAGMESGYRVVHARGEHIHTDNGERIAYVWYMDEGVYIEGDEAAGTQMNRAMNTALHEESILRATHYDGLTGLPNLAWFFELSEATKARIFSEGKQGHLLYLDLNGMKYFNNRYGFAEGDKLLRAFAEALAEIFGRENCCHIAADRFAATAAADASEEKIRLLFDRAGQMNGGRTLPVRVGIYSTEMEDVPVSSAFDRAKTACDAIRRSDTSGFHFYDAKLRDEMRRHQYLAANIDRAVEERWIRPYYQQIIRASDGTLCDEEALARWIDPVEGFLSW